MKHYLRAIAICSVFALFGGGVSLLAAQSSQFFLPANTGFIGFLSANGKAPVGTGCTIAAGSTDAAGECTASASSGSIVFAKTDLTVPPFCMLQDQTGTPLNVFDVTALQITLTTITNAHKLRWFCVAQAGL